MMFTADNWYKWRYSVDGEDFSRADNGKKLYTSYDAKVDPCSIRDLGYTLLENAKSTIDCYPNRTFDLLYSGGMDSEVVMRTYKKLGHPIRVSIFRYEKNYNIYDVSFAVVTCEQLGIPYKIIDFNLERFYYKEAETVSEQAQCDRPRALPQMKFMEYVDGLPVYASSDCRWYRPHDDYTKRAEWIVQDLEHELSWDKYAQFHNIEAIVSWFKWTPEIVLSWANTNWFKRLVSDQISGKLGVLSTKIEGYREVFPDLLTRVKKTGMETVDHITLDFQMFLYEKYGGLPYRQTYERTINELWVEMTGERYDFRNP